MAAFSFFHAYCNTTRCCISKSNFRGINNLGDPMETKTEEHTNRVRTRVIALLITIILVFLANKGIECALN